MQGYSNKTTDTISESLVEIVNEELLALEKQDWPRVHELARNWFTLRSQEYRTSPGGDKNRGGMTMKLLTP